MGEPIRTFIAIELNDALHHALGEVQHRLQREPAARLIRWVAPSSIHITLKFLGDVEANQLPALHDALVKACEDTPPFVLTLAGLGAFPNTKRPNNLWVGATGQVEVAAQLAQKIDAACTTLGFPRETRPFTTHLTLGRVKKDVSPSERASIGAMVEAMRVNALGDLRVDHVSVMKSELRPSGSVYTRLYAIELYA